MMNYNQLTYAERYLIQQCHQNGKSNAVIGKLLGRDRSSIGRELKRNSSSGSYEAEKAQALADERAGRSGSPRKLTATLWKTIKRLLRN